MANQTEFTDQAVKQNIFIAQSETLSQTYQFIDENFDSSTIPNANLFSELPDPLTIVDPDNYYYVLTDENSNLAGYYFADNVGGIWVYLGIEKPFDFRNYTGKSQVRIDNASNQLAVEISVTFPTPYNGLVNLGLTSAQTQPIKEDKYLYDVYLTDNTDPINPVSTRYIYGQFNLTKGTTKLN
jgi:hypothetical protein